MTVQQIVLPPPLLGLNKRAAHSMMEEAYTPDSLNVWPYDWAGTGRQRIGSAVGLSSVASTGAGSPYNWCDVSYYSSGTKVGIAVTGANGTYTTLDGSTWTPQITTNPGTDFASCACYLQILFQARGGGTCRYKGLGQNPISGGDIQGSGELSSDNADDGVAPLNCGLVQRWGDRLVLGGDTEHPHQIYMSRIGDPFDWDYSAVDPAAPVSIAGTGGMIGEPVTALIPHNQQCLLIGCTDSMYVLRGNPASGGVLEQLSHSVGPLMHSAWCKDGEDYTWLLTRDGLYRMSPGCGAPPQRVSRQVLPEELVGIDPGGQEGAVDKVSLVYDNRFNGIHIFVDYSSATDVSFFYDLGNGGFWKQSFSSTIQLGCVVKTASTATKSGVFAINSSGTALQFDEDAAPSDSHIYYGPIAIGSPHNAGMLLSVDAVLGNSSEDIAWSVYADNSPEEAFNGSAQYTGETWTQGAGGRYSMYREHPRVRGAAAYLKLEDVSGSRWSIEELLVETAQVGRKRA